MRRRSFFLLEALVAIAIVMLVAGFFLHNPLFQARGEIDTLFAMEQERLWELELAKIKAELPQKAEGVKSKRGEALWETAVWRFEIAGVKKKMEKRYRLWCPASSEGVDGTKYYKVYLEEEKDKKKDSPDYVFFVVK